MTEPREQPNEKDEIADFLDWVQKNRVNGTLGSSDTVDSPFLPWNLLEAHLKFPGRLQKIIRALFWDTQVPPVNAHDIWDRQYVKAFTILILIDQGHFIPRMVNEPSLSDIHLPFVDKPKHFPRLRDGDDTLWYKFYRKQFQICPHTFVCRATNIHLEDEEVLPIIKKELIRKGGHATIYMIKFYAEYDKLSSEDQPNQNITNRPANTYAVKKYTTPEAQIHYLQEVAAFRHLAFAENAEQYLVAFYGSFEFRGECNLILEYADFPKGNTLELYLQKVTPPARSEDIYHLWQSLFNIIKALWHIHELKTAHGTELQGWHQDVDPSNILVFSGQTASDYDVKFKLADLGLSHFKGVRGEDTDAAEPDAWGTRIYGAPESCRWDDFIASATVRVKRFVDIWSLGCVFSEVATWIVYGDVKKYRQERSDEINRLSRGSFSDGPIFHDTESVLKSVSRNHEYIRQDGLRRSDFVTGEVISQMIGSMLERLPEARPTATVLHTMSSRILEDAAQKISSLRSRNSDPVVHTSPEPLTLSSPDASPVISRPVPPSIHSAPTMRVSINSHDFENMTVAHRAATGHAKMRAEHSPPRLGRFSSPDTPPNARVNRSSTQAYDPSPELQRMRVQEQAEAGEQAQGHFGAHVPHNPHKRKSRHEGVFEVSASNASRKGAFSPVPNTSEPLFYRETSVRQGTPTKQEPPEINTQVSPHQRDRRRYDGGRTLSSQEWAKLRPPKLLLSQARQHIADTKQETKLTSRFSSQRKSATKSFEQTYYSYFNDLNGRDHVFLIDDSASMADHWPNVKELLYVLGWLIKRRDPDGFDVFFTVSADDPKHRNFQNAGPAQAYLSKITPSGFPNMDNRLSAILRRKEYDIRRKPLSIYVFTDGNWQAESSPEASIRNTVDILNRNSLPKDSIGIQFVQFGNHTVGTDRLNYLDSDLGKKIKVELLAANPHLGIKSKVWDIVDTEPYSDGDVMKMLMGAVNPSFDDDGDDLQEYLVDDPQHDAHGKAAEWARRTSVECGEIKTPSMLWK